MAKTKKKMPLTFGLKNGRLSIEIGIETLINACGEALEGQKVTSQKTFGREVLGALADEEEDGTTLVHRMFDDAIRNALEQGAQGVMDVTNDDGDE